MSVGHNTRASDAVQAYHLSQLMKAQDEKKSQDGKYSSHLSRLQAKGVDIRAAKDAIKIHKDGNAADEVAYLQALANNLRILGTPLENDQADFFAKPAASLTPEERAAEDGFGAGALGLGSDKNPHDTNTALGQAWLKAWHEGCAERKKVADAVAAEEAEEADVTEDDDEDGEQTDIEDNA